jgi:hypothetical protein
MVEGLWHMWMFGCRRAKEKRPFHGTHHTQDQQEFFQPQLLQQERKGVYFAVDASYSIDDIYSRPDS